MPRLLRRLRDVLLLPLALLMVVLEDVVWAAIVAVLRGLRQIPALRALETWLASLPGYAALPLFLIPEVIGIAGKMWAIALLTHGRTTAAVEAYVLIRLVSSLVAVFIYRACEASLLRIGWFAGLVGWVHVARDWAMGLVRPLGLRLRVVFRTVLAPLLRRGRGRLLLRWLAIRRWVRERIS